jgi:hypothetical protein
MTIHPVPKKPRRPRSRQPLKRGGRIRARNQKRHSREWRRAYHSVERVEFVKGLPSVVSGERPCENAHTENGGMGRKADYQTIVPLTPREHVELHNFGPLWFTIHYPVDLKAAAAETEAAWQAYLNLQEPTE